MPSNEQTIRELVALLNADANDAQDAQHALQEYDEAVLLPLLEAAPGFGPFGQLCSIELLHEIGDPRAATVLIPMLRGEHDTVREWAASALGDLHVQDAVPEIRRAYDAVKRRRTPLDWTEPEALRHALTQLGARREVVPPQVEALSRTERTFQRCWAPKDLVAVIDSLADADQLVLYFQFWKRRRDTHTWRDTPSWEINWSLPWAQLVEAARQDAREAARQAGTPRKTVATLAWINEDDT
jgi:hypothetical protein